MDCVFVQILIQSNVIVVVRRIRAHFCGAWGWQNPEDAERRMGSIVSILATADRSPIPCGRGSHWGSMAGPRVRKWPFNNVYYPGTNGSCWWDFGMHYE